jgi:hypothetical protein
MDVVASTQALEFTVPEGTHTHTESEEATDLCSPFCQCTCCTTLSLIFAQNIGIHNQIQGERGFMFPLSAKSLDVSPSVWQPPKMA